MLLKATLAAALVLIPVSASTNTYTPARYQLATKCDKFQAAQNWLNNYYKQVYETAVSEPVQPKTRYVLARVTACSPYDSDADKRYYAKYGYEGGVYGIAACYKQFPKGTKIRVPGYLNQSYPNKFWEVDSKGGPVIRNSSRRGIIHIDVKFATLYSVKQWGSKWMYVEVMDE